jgi:hypothetical protein
MGTAHPPPCISYQLVKCNLPSLAIFLSDNFNWSPFLLSSQGPHSLYPIAALATPAQTAPSTEPPPETTHCRTNTARVAGQILVRVPQHYPPTTATFAPEAAASVRPVVPGQPDCASSAGHPFTAAYATYRWEEPMEGRRGLRASL